MAYFSGSAPILDQPYPRAFQPLAARDDIEGDAFTFIESRQPGLFESRHVDEYVLPTIITDDEAEPLSALNYLTVPVSSTDASEDRSSDLRASVAALGV